VKHQWLSDIELIQIGAFSASYSTHVSLSESESGFEIVTQLADTGKRPSSYL
jgi:hypothetical protein